MTYSILPDDYSSKDLSSPAKSSNERREDSPQADQPPMDFGEKLKSAFSALKYSGNRQKSGDSRSRSPSESSRALKAGGLKSGLGVVGEAVRVPAMLAANTLADIGGSIGDAGELAKETILRPAAELFGIDIDKTKLPGLTPVFPTSQQARKAVKDASSGYLAPRGKVEEYGSEFLTDLAYTILPGLREVRGLRAASRIQRIPRAFFTALGANALKGGVEDFTGSESAGSFAKMGAFMVAALVNPKKIGQYVSGLYKARDAAIPAGTRVGATSLEQTANGLVRQMNLGTGTAAENFVAGEAQAVLQKIQNGTLTVEEAIAAKRSISQKLQDTVYTMNSSSEKHKVRKWAKKLTYELDKMLTNYGKENPAFGVPHKEAEEGFAAIQKSNFISNWIEDNVKNAPFTKGLLELLTQKGGSAFLPWEGVKALYRIMKAPSLREYYARVMKAATQENAAVMAKELKKLDDGLKKQERMDTYSIVD